MHTSSIGALQRYARGLGAVFTVLAAAMSASAGYAFGGDSTYAAVILAALLAGLTIAVALMLNFVDLAWASGERKLAGGIFAAFVVCLIGEYASHVAFGTGHRAANIEAATLQTTRYDDGRASVADNEAALKMFTTRLKQLEDQHAWAPTITADALRAQAEAEERRGGCGQRCLMLKARVAIAEEAHSLRSQIDATRRVLADLRAKSAQTLKGESVAHNQSQIYATIATGSLVPAASAVQWANIAIGAYLSMLSTGLGALFNWLGFHKFRAGPAREGSSTEPAIARSQPTPAGMPMEPIHVHTFERSDELRRWAMLPEVKAVLGQQVRPA
jgi:hypothetical protein